MKKLYFLTFSFLCSNALAFDRSILSDLKFIDEKIYRNNIETYRVLESDTFSSVVKRHTKRSTKTFNENANAIRLHNPQIQNINKLVVGQLIYLPTTVSTRDIASSPKDQIKVTDSPRAEESQYWNIGFNYGSKYLNLSQTGVLGKADLGAIVPKSINLYSQYHNGDYSFGVSYQSYALKYKANGVTESQDFNSFNLLFGYKSLVTGFEFSEEPLFKNDNGTIIYSKYLTKKFKLGFIKEWNFKSRKPTSLELSSILDYQFEGDSSDKDIEISKTSGYGVKINTTLKRELYRKPSYQVFVVWPTFMNYQENSSTINWGASSGESKSTKWEVGTQLGIEIKF
jgi:hypothetical protein